MTSRRKFLQNLGAASILPFVPAALNTNKSPEILYQILNYNWEKGGAAADEEDFWRLVQEAYTVSPNIINLNNGGVSPQSRRVQEAQDLYNRESNEGPAYYMWRIVDKGRLNVKRKLAEIAGASPDEIAIQRNTTEALENLIFGFDMKAGDEIITSSQDYPSMQNALNQRARREGIQIKRVSISVPLDNEEELVKRFEKSISAKTKMILLCHMINLTGQILPVRAICRLGRQHGIPVIVDGAHSFAHFPFSMDELECDYFGTSLHKWLCAPFGTGMLYIRKEKIKTVWPLLAAPDGEEEKIEKFEHLGTRSFPAEMAIGHAIDFHRGIGGQRKAARLRYLSDYWVSQVKDLPKIRFNTSFREGSYGAIVNFAIDGMSAVEIQKELFRDYRIYTIAIDHEEVKGVRVSPHIYTTLNDLDTLITAIRGMITR